MENLAIKSGRQSSVAAATEIVITGLPPSKAIVIRKVKLVKVSGAVATFTPVLGTATNPAGTVAVIVSGAGGTVLWDVNTNILCQTDSLGQLYLRPVPNTGTDGVVDWIVGYSI